MKQSILSLQYVVDIVNSPVARFNDSLVPVCQHRLRVSIRGYHPQVLVPIDMGLGT